MPKSFNAKYLTVGLFVIFLVVAFYLGILFERKNSENRLQKANAEITSASKEKIKNLEEELDLAISNRGKWIETTKGRYNFSDFGTKSDLFKDKDVETSTYTYKKAKILDKYLTIEKDKLGVNVWEFSGINYRASTDYTDPNFVVFYAYENHATVAIPLREKMKFDKSYATKKGLKMYWNDEAFRGVYNISLELFSPSSVTGHPVFVRVVAAATGKNFDDPALNQAKERVKQVADTISLK